MTDHSFNPFIAQKYDVNAAIFLNSMIFWTRLNASNGNNYHNDRYWTYNTPESMVKYFPYWSPDQIKRIIKKLIDLDLIVKSNYNKKGYDRTNWYALSDKALIELNLDKTCLQPLQGFIVRNRPMDSAKSPDGLGEIARPIPDTNSSTNAVSNKDINARDENDFDPTKPLYLQDSSQATDSTLSTGLMDRNEITLAHAPPGFKKFWNAYPLKKNIEKTLAQWLHDGCEPYADQIIEKLNIQKSKDKSFKDGCVRNPWAYILEKGYLDEVFEGKKTKGKFDHDDSSWADSDRQSIFD